MQKSELAEGVSFLADLSITDVEVIADTSGIPNTLHIRFSDSTTLSMGNSFYPATPDSLAYRSMMASALLSGFAASRLFDIGHRGGQIVSVKVK